MKKSLNIRILTINVLFFTVSWVNIYSQGTNTGGTQSNRFFIGFDLLPSQTSISNTISSTVGIPESTRKNSFGGAISAGYFFSKYFGISSGLGYSVFSTDLTLGLYSATMNAKDSDQESYIRNISGTNISECQKIGLLNIPILAEIKVPLGSAFGLTIQTGINLGIPIGKKYSSSGTFSYSGFYPAYNVTISDVPFENFSNGVINQIEGDLELNGINPQFAASGGLYYLINENLQISLGVSFNKCFSNLSGYSPSDSFILSAIPDEMNSLMAGSSKVSAQAVGLRVGFRYYLK